jgi:uncharacterized YccA/Bax inhibitor family protein
MLESTLTAAARVAAAFVPLMLGAAVGFLLVLVGLRHWVISLPAGGGGRGHLTRSLARLGASILVVGVLITLAAAHFLHIYVFQGAYPGLAQQSLWGLPFGIGFGVRWVYLRGLR